MSAPTYLCFLASACPEYRRLVMASPSERLDIARHMLICATCTHALEDYHATHGMQLDAAFRRVVELWLDLARAIQKRLQQ